MNLTVNGIRVYLFMFPFVSISIIGSTYFQSIGKARIAMFLSLLRQLILLVPLLMILPPFLGFYSVEKKFAKMCEANGIEHTDRSLTFLILGFVPFGWFIIAAMFQAEFNKIKSIIG